MSTATKLKAPITYTGTITKQSSLPGQLANFNDGFKQTGTFLVLPKKGEPFYIYPTTGEYAGGYFHTSRIVKIGRESRHKGKRLVKLMTLNSTYLLSYAKTKAKLT